MIKKKNLFQSIMLIALIGLLGFVLIGVTHAQVPTLYTDINETTMVISPGPNDIIVAPIATCDPCALLESLKQKVSELNALVNKLEDICNYDPTGRTCGSITNSTCEQLQTCKTCDNTQTCRTCENLQTCKTCAGISTCQVCVITKDTATCPSLVTKDTATCQIQPITKDTASCQIQPITKDTATCPIQTITKDTAICIPKLTNSTACPQPTGLACTPDWNWKLPTTTPVW
jgi:hypothetical protein